MNKRTTYLIVAVFLFFSMVSYSNIRALETKIDNLNNTIYSLESQLNNQISSIYKNVDEQLSEQESLVHDAYFEVGTLNTDTLTVPITFTVEPKAVTETMMVSLNFDGGVIPLEKNGLEYSYTGDFGIAETIFPTIVFEDNGLQTVEEYNGLDTASLKEKIFPLFFASYVGQSPYGTYGNDEYREKAALFIAYTPVSEDVQFTSMKYVVKVDGEIIEETPIPLEDVSINADEPLLELDNTYPLHEGQTLTSSVIAVDSLGFTHEILMTQYDAGAEAQMEPNYGEVTITAPDGERAYIFDEK